MLPRELQASQFAGYPPQARQLAAGLVSLLQQLPIGFLPLLLQMCIRDRSIADPGMVLLG